MKLLEGIRTGDVSHIDQEGLRQLQAVSANNVADLHARLCELNKRLGLPGT
jgi:hypothetical protein